MHFIHLIYINNPIESALLGVVHGDDVTLTFASVSNARLSESDMKMKNILLDVLESFANTR